MKEAANLLDGIYATSEFTPADAAARGDFLPEDDAPTGDDMNVELNDEELDEELDHEADEDLGDSDGELAGDDHDDADDDGLDDHIDDDDSPEEAGEPDADDASEGDSRKSPANQRVPLKRLNKEVAKRRDAESRVAELERQLADARQAPAGSDDSAPKQPKISKDQFEVMQEAMLDGDTDKAFEIFSGIVNGVSDKDAPLDRDALRDEIRQELKLEADNKALVEKAKQLSERYPMLDSSSDLADSALIEEVVDLRNTFIERGQPMAEALERAVKIVAMDNDLKDAKAADIAAPPRKRGISPKKLDAARRERGKLGGDSNRGKEEPAINLSTMTDEQFASLSAEAKARLRGDHLV